VALAYRGATESHGNGPDKWIHLAIEKARRRMTFMRAEWLQQELASSIDSEDATAMT